MSIDLFSEEGNERRGKRLLTFVGEWDYKASIVYVEGIPFFDMELGDYKFAETDCRIAIEIYEYAMLFFLLAKHGALLRGFGVWNKDMLSMEMTKDVPIIVPKFSRWERVRPWAPVSGAIGYTIASFRKDKAARNREFKIIGTREVIGWMMKLFYTDDNDGSKKTITFNILKDYHHNFFESTFTSCWNIEKNR